MLIKIDDLIFNTGEKNCVVYYRKLNKNKISFTLLQGRERREKIVDMCSAPGLCSYVRFTGHLGNSNLPAFNAFRTYLQCDLI